MAEENKKKIASKKAANFGNKKKSSGTTKKSMSSLKNESSKKLPSHKNDVTALPEEEENSFSFKHQLMIVLIAVAAVFVTICFIFPNNVGILGLGIANGFFGTFGLSTFLVPFLILQLAFFWKRDVLSGAVRYKYLISMGVLLLTAVLIHVLRGLALREVYTFSNSFVWENLKKLFFEGMEYQGGGFLGGSLAIVLICCVGYPGALIFGFLFLIALLMALFGLTPTECVQRYLFYRQRAKSKRLLRRQEREAERERKRAEKEAARLREEEEAAALNEKFMAEDDDDDEFEEKYEEKKSLDAEDEENLEEPLFESARASARATVSATAENSVLRNTERSVALVSEPAQPAPRNTLIVSGTERKSYGQISAEKENPIEMPIHTESEKKSFSDDGQTENISVENLKDEDLKAKTLAWDPEETTEAVSEEFLTEEELPVDEETGEIMILPPEPMVAAPDTVDEDGYEEFSLPPAYEFPPLDMLRPPEEMSRDENVSQELRENADKIIDTLESFHVRVNISHVSRGPTVTRYELEPAAGTRVRSITNLLDDIALSLATSGVRSDGIITGKSAIGIEVPNKIVNTVYIRELIDDERFADAKSRLTTCLGMDVSGAPVYLDIAKMPHLLIAGATGMGKSVCINSLLVSLLYKASPDEVKLILIDPKKVELNIYNGIPHLLVPVVFDPKKAAGSLHWAVTEMERRFELIEAKNTRNIAQYNAAIADDPKQEFLPQIVIIIDELADLMMSAPDDVEASICRLAQKARAAGMHLIIGTQRPSVDVITGLIKANIPSRIAFTVASQIDSRTIIDAQGAEKLIGRGDMLYAPVGASKPVRVQGAFVSETEIEEIVGFIRSQSFGSAYSDDVMAQINKAAELCGQKKGKGGAPLSSDGEADKATDPMLDSAVALAVETGKISTSLIQRSLSLGYGRAAKLIDIMERRGIVGPPEGQKPRAVLITREQYLEMQMNKSEESSSQIASDEAPF